MYTEKQLKALDKRAKNFCKDLKEGDFIFLSVNAIEIHREIDHYLRKRGMSTAGGDIPQSWMKYPQRISFFNLKDKWKDNFSCITINNFYTYVAIIDFNIKPMSKKQLDSSNFISF